MMNKVKALLTATLETLWGVGVSVVAGTLLERLYNPPRAAGSICRSGAAEAADGSLPSPSR